MAERRMLHKKASVSSDLATLRVKQGPDALAFFLLMIPHLDRWGCVPDDAVTLRGMVVPLWEDVTSKDVKRWCDWMVRRGMLARVTGPNGDRGLRSLDFHEHQRGSEFAKEAPSPFEPRDITSAWERNGRSRRGVPKGADLQGGRRPVADQVATKSHGGLRERNGKEGKVNPSLSVPSREGGAGEGGGPVGSAGSGQPPGPAGRGDDEQRLLDERAARELRRAEELVPIRALLSGDGGAE